MDSARNLQVDVRDAVQGSIPRSSRGSEQSLSPTKSSRRNSPTKLDRGNSPTKLDRLHSPTKLDRGLVSRCPSPAHGFLVLEATPDEINTMYNSPRVGMGSRGNIDDPALSHNHDRPLQPNNPSMFDLEHPEQSHLEFARH
jgi:hypothetical protein